MEFITAARNLRALSIRPSHRQPKRSKLGFAIGAFIALIAMSPLAMTDARATTAVGAIAGSAGVSATGAATYTIPITLPPGTHGMQPSLALTYNSQSGDGFVGFGWSLSGISSITRCAQDKEDDGLTLPIQYIAGDDYCLDGQRLVVTNGGAQGGNGTTYGTQLEQFSVITSYTGAPINNGPSWFTVQTKDGRTYEYGNTTDSKVIAGGFSTRVRVWALDKVTDANGNYMTYTYGSNSAGTDYFPTQIAYTGNGGTTPDHTVAFTYTTRSPGTLKASYQSGALIVFSRLLNTITITTSGTSYSYTLGYGSDPVNSRQQLQSVQECGTDGSCMAATTIAWQNAHQGWGADVDTGVSLAGASHALDAHLIDVDGDGIKDLVFTNGSTGNWQVMFGQPGGGFSTVRDTGDATTGIPADSIALDYNGDGKMDLAVPYPGVSGWVVLQSTGSRTAGAGHIFNALSNNIPGLTGTNSASGLPIYEGNVWPVSFTGNGAASDLVYSNGAHINFMNNSGPATGDSFGTPTSVLNVTQYTRENTPSSVDIGVDFDGSTRAGGLLLDESNDQWVALTQSSTDTALNVMGTIGTDVNNSGIPTSNGQPFYAIPMDANGDGQTDVLSGDARGVLLLSLSTGSISGGFIPLTEGLYQSTAPSDPVVADYYADGRQEAIVKVAGPAWDILDTYFSTAGHFVTTQTGYGSSPYTTAPYGTNYIQGSLRVGNISASGLDDLVYAVSTGPSTFDWHYRLHNGGAPDLVTSITDGFGNVASFQYASLADGTVYTKGNGAVYPIQDIQSTMHVVSEYTFTPVTAAPYHFNYTYSTARTDTNGRGFLGFASWTITDSRSGDVETKSYSQTWPWTGMVTSDVLAKSNGDKIRDTENTGADDLADNLYPSGRDFPFFDTSTTTDYDFVSGTVQPIRVTKKTLNQGSFDNYGNLWSTSTEVGQPGTFSPNYIFGTAGSVRFAPPGSVYCANLPTRIGYTSIIYGSPYSSSMTRVVTATEDTTLCQPNSQTVASGQTGDGTLPLTTTYVSRDAYGNVTEADTGTGAAARKILYNFTGGGNGEFSTSVKNVVSGSASLVSYATWNYAFGVELTSTDPNSNQTTFGYDGFGRLTSVTRPDNSGTTLAYANCPSAGSTYCPSGAAYEVTTSAFNNLSGTGKVTIITGYTAYDSLGRVIEQGSVLFGGSVNSQIDTSYDAMGNVASVSKPYLTGASQVFSTSYSYDLAMGRLLSVATPQDHADTCSPACENVITFSYNGLTTTSTQTVTNFASPTGTHMTQRTVDLLGQTTSVQDANGGVTTYNYDPIGDLIATHDVNNKLTTMSYDGLSHKTGMVDPNMGAWSYQLDAFGEITCQVDAKMQSIVMAYDAVGRVTTKTETSPQSGPDCAPASGDVVYTGNWTYDTATKGLGLLASASDSNGFSRSYTYDTVSRPSSVTAVTGTGPVASYATSTSYDNFGRLATLTYPATAITGLAPFAINYNYDSASGALASISDGTTTYWQVATGGSATPVDAFGHILAYEDGNTVSTVTAYDQATGAILGIGTGIGTSTSVQQLSYSWDGFGNLKQRCDANKGLTESFTYDVLNRISTSAVNTGATSCSGGTVEAAMGLSYDAIGNIQTRTNTGIMVGSGTLNDTYTYGSSSHPYAVTGVTSMPGTYVYDANGNMTSGNGRAVTWNDDNLPTSITSTSTVNGNNAVTGSSTFSYSPDLQRYYQTTTDSIAGNSNTTYIGSLFEVVSSGSSTLYRHNIMAGGSVVAVHTIDQSGAATNAYIHTDHLGSSDTITDDTGTVVQQSSFDAFGLRRDPTNWAYDLTGTQIASLKSKTDRGYTFQEQLDNVGLVDMNGRVYDPSIGRMISADSTIPNQLYSQGFNRYAYVYNNPLAMTDPSGYDPCGEDCLQENWADTGFDSSDDSGLGADTGNNCTPGNTCDIGKITATANRPPQPYDNAQYETWLLQSLSGPEISSPNDGGGDGKSGQKDPPKDKQPPKKSSCNSNAANNAASSSTTSSTVNAAADTAGSAGTAADTAASAVEDVAAGAIVGGAANPGATAAIGKIMASGLSATGAAGGAVVLGVGAYNLAQGDTSGAVYAVIDTGVGWVVTDAGLAGAPETLGGSIAAAGAILGTYTYFGGSKGIAGQIGNAVQTAENAFKSQQSQTCGAN